MNSDLLYKYFQGQTSQEQEAEISAWLESGEENVAKFREAFALFETLSFAPEQTADQQKTSKVRKVSRIALWALANAAALCAIFFGAKYLSQSRSDRALEQTLLSVSAPLGQRVDFTLPDGTLVKLNSGATLSYPMQFSKDHRDVSLEGEAYFKVSHNADRPFEVSTFATTVEVLGTEFNIAADKSQGDFSLALVQGSVKVSSHYDALVLHAGESVRLEGGHLMFSDIIPSGELSWTNDLLNIGGVDFVTLIRKMEKAFGVTIVLERQDVPKLNCTSGELRLSDGLDYALSTLRHLADFSYERDFANNTVVIR